MTTNATKQFKSAITEPNGPRDISTVSHLSVPMALRTPEECFAFLEQAENDLKTIDLEMADLYRVVVTTECNEPDALHALMRCKSVEEACKLVKGQQFEQQE